MSPAVEMTTYVVEFDPETSEWVADAGGQVLVQRLGQKHRGTGVAAQVALQQAVAEAGGVVVLEGIDLRGVEPGHWRAHGCASRCRPTPRCRWR